MCDPMQAALPGCGLSLFEKTESAVELLRNWAGKAAECGGELGYWGVDGGGKWSACARQLCKSAGVKVGWHFNATESDVPELRQFIRKMHADTSFHEVRVGVLDAALDEPGVLLRNGTWCQREFKSWGGEGRFKLMRWRWEPTGRLPVFWGCLRTFGGVGPRAVGVTSSWVMDPLEGWSGREIAEFVKRGSLSHWDGEGKGADGVGCIGCPMKGQAALRRDFVRWPAIARGWERAFERLWERRRGSWAGERGTGNRYWPGIPGINSAEALFRWWVDKPGRPDEEGCSGWAGR